ncbi:MAG TPA: ATP-binding protein [Planktothrix sp.]|jgi:PAS domain S-box-containing protein
MKVRLSLASKGLILIVVSLTCVLAMMAWLVHLHNEAEAAASRAEHAKLIADATNQMERDIYAIASGADGNQTDERIFFNGQFDPVLDDIKAQLKVLSELVKDDPGKRMIVARANQSGQQALAILTRARVLFNEGTFVPGSPVRAEALKNLRVCVKGMVSQEVLNIAREEKDVAREAPEVHAHFVQQVQISLIVATILIITMTVGAYLLFSFNIIHRLKVMLDNNMRLASGAPLNPVQPGDDEIADLDKAFHNMASALNEAVEKERAVIANAMDVIYSLDERGTIVSVNDAATTVFGFTPSELIGNKFINLATEKERPHVLNFLKLMTEGGKEPPFEMQLIRKDGRVIDIIWSARWSEKSKTIFCVAHDLTERKQAERLRQEVVQMVSHDLKTPLSTVRSFLEMLEAGVFGELTPRGLQLLKLADMSTSRMLTLTKDLLDIEKMEAGMLKLNTTESDLSSIFEQVGNGIAAMASEQGVQYVMVENRINLVVDPDRLVQILTNLSTNAIKFSRRGESVTLSASETVEAVEILVSDKGRGIPEHVQATIFDRFSQVRASDATEKGGSGLGLAICKALVELHGGRISVQSEEGKGSTFTVVLPKIPGAAEADGQPAKSEQTTTAEPPALTT